MYMVVITLKLPVVFVTGVFQLPQEFLINGVTGAWGWGNWVMTNPVFQTDPVTPTVNLNEN